ncbi:MAG TPA: DUF4124 domain-containing protein [Steroidobacteraceae bacterium]
MSVRLRPGVLGMLVAFVGWVPVALAATTTGPVPYKWTDDQGIVHYGDSVPPQYAQKERSVLNARGVEVRKLDAQKTPEQLAAEARAQGDVVKQKQHDAFLMNTYTSVKDIEALRDLRLDQLHGQRVAAEQYVDSLHARLSALQDRAKNFKPYNPRPAAHKMPDDVAEDLVHTLNELRTQNNALVAKTEEETTLKAQFQADIERYEELRRPTR